MESEVQDRAEDLERFCGSVEHASTIVSRHANPGETDLPIYVCRDLTISVVDAWQKLKRFM